MKTIKLKPTGKQIYYHEYFAPFILEADADIPKLTNMGYNSFSFLESINFVGVNIPIQICEKVSKKLFKEQAQIKVFRKDGTSISGVYYRTTFDGVITETFDFS